MGMAEMLCEMLGQPSLIKPEDIWVDDTFLGAAYGRVSASTVKAIRLMAESEGVLLDPVYTGKAFAGLISLARQERLRVCSNAIFIAYRGCVSLVRLSTGLAFSRVTPG